MHQVVVDLVACLPALVLGLVMPSIFSVFGLAIEGPANKPYMALSIIMYPYFIGAAVWMIWYEGLEFSLVKFFLALLLVVGLAAVATWLRREIVPIVWAKVRSFLKWADEWLYSHSP